MSVWLVFVERGRVGRMVGSAFATYKRNPAAAQQPSVSTAPSSPRDGVCSVLCGRSGWLEGKDGHH